MKSNQNNLALFGTSADPPTNGHKEIIKELADIYPLVITYASDNPSKKHRENLFFRSLLLKTLIDEFNNKKIFFDQEISSPWAIKSIQKCKKKYNNHKIDFVIGSDLLEDIFSWRKFDQILKESKLFIIPRDGYPIKSINLKLIKDYKGSYEISSLMIPKVSSSEIRLKIQDSYLPKSITALIKSNNLYNFSNIEE